METKISPEEIKKIKETEGEVRGVSFNIFKDFIEREGKEDLRRVERKLQEIGYPIDFGSIEPMKFYPAHLLSALGIVIKHLFHYSPKKFEEFGAFRARSSLLLRLYLKYFASLKKMADKAPEIWRKSVSAGDFRVVEFDEKKKYVIMRLKSYYDLIPEQCDLFKGLFSEMVKIAVKSPVSCQETKCTFRGDDYHEFLLKW